MSRQGKWALRCMGRRGVQYSPSRVNVDRMKVLLSDVVVLPHSEGPAG